MSVKWEISDELRAAIRGLYVAFEKYDKKTEGTGCHHCTSEQDWLVLNAKPLRQLSASDLARFAFKAMTTLGTLNDFKRFLPRMFELIVTEGDSGVESEITLGKLQYSQDTTRPRYSAEEQAAVNSFLRAWWVDSLSAVHEASEFERRLVSVGCAVADISEFLTIWRETDKLSSAVNLARLVEWHSTKLYRSQTISPAFWHYHPQHIASVVRFIADPVSRAFCERWFFETKNAEFQLELSTAVAVMDFLIARDAGSAS